MEYTFQESFYTSLAREILIGVECFEGKEDTKKCRIELRVGKTDDSVVFPVTNDIMLLLINGLSYMQECFSRSAVSLI